MNKTVNIFNKETGSNSPHFFETLEAEVGSGNRCFNCEFCGDIVSEKGLVKESVIECLGRQAGIQNIKIGESCLGHKLISDYRDLRKGD